MEHPAIRAAEQDSVSNKQIEAEKERKRERREREAGRDGREEGRERGWKGVGGAACPCSLHFQTWREQQPAEERSILAANTRQAGCQGTGLPSQLFFSLSVFHVCSGVSP